MGRDGFKVVIGPHAFDRWGYFAGRDRDHHIRIEHRGRTQALKEISG